MVLSLSMGRIPFGVSRLDSMVGGGAPPGSAVALVTEVGAGGRDFMYTSAIMNALLQADDELFEFYYGSLDPASEPPASVRYLSFTTSSDAVFTEMEYSMDTRIVDRGREAISFQDLSTEYFRQSPVPTEWYMERPQEITTLGTQHGYEDVYEAIGAHLEAMEPRSLLVIDSITDLLSISDEDMDWNNITLLIKGLKKVFDRKDGLLLMLADAETLTETELGGLTATADGTFMFEWASGGTQRDRTMFVKQFRGILSRLEDEDIIRFETDLTDSGFDISDVRKIR